MDIVMTLKEGEIQKYIEEMIKKNKEAKEVKSILGIEK